MAGFVIRVKLPRDRTRTGTVELIDPLTGLTAFGPVPVLGRAARNAAAQHGNPAGDPLQPFGDTPLGEYDVPAVLRSGDGTNHPAPAYGPKGVVVMEPVGGPAAQAKANGRTGLLIHSGRQVATPTPLPSHLRPTNGCLRMLESDLGGLIEVMRSRSVVFPGKVRIEVTEAVGAPGAGGDNVDDGDPPPLGGTPVIP